MTKRLCTFGLLTAITSAVFLKPLIDVVRLSSHSELYSHIMLIPLVAGVLIWKERKDIFAQLEGGIVAGCAMLLAGFLIRLLARKLAGTLEQNDYLSLSMLGFVLAWIGAFICAFGQHSFRKAAFPLIFLIFAIPIPSFLLDGMISFLQKGSTEAASLLFSISGVPFFRDGFTFALPGMSIEVAPQCSGIRSGLALFITSILAGRLFLRTPFKKNNAGAIQRSDHHVQKRLPDRHPHPARRLC